MVYLVSMIRRNKIKRPKSVKELPEVPTSVVIHVYDGLILMSNILYKSKLTIFYKNSHKRRVMKLLVGVMDRINNKCDDVPGR